MTVYEMIYSEYKQGIKNGLYDYTQVLFAYNSNHIEGSTLTLNQTLDVYETNSFVADKDEIVKVNDVLEAKNHFKAFNFILDNCKNELNTNLVKQIHYILKQGTSDAVIGDFKKRANFVGNRITTKPKFVKNEIESLFNDYNINSNITFEDIIAFHYAFECIHPFEDGNGRVGRLIAFKECLKHDITPFIIDEEHKLFYYRGLREYEHTKGYLLETCLSSQDKYKDILAKYTETALTKESANKTRKQR